MIGKKWRVVIGLAVIAIVLGGCGKTGTSTSPVRTVTSTPTPTPTGPVVTLKNVVDNGNVPYSTLVQGTVTGLPSGQALWAVVKPVVSDYYPQGSGPVTVDTTGNWAVKCVFGTLEEGSGGQFQLMIVATNSAGNQAFVSHQQAGAAQNWVNYPGMKALPSDTLILKTVIVTRMG